MASPLLRDIEWQLVMHFSTHADITRLARCSKDTLRAASSPFAWRHSTARFDSTRHPPPRGCVAALAPVHYLWRPARRYPQDTDELVESKLRVDHLDASDNTYIDPACWERVLRAPVMQHVRQLTFPRGLHSQSPSASQTFSCLPLIVALPHLTTLDLGCLPEMPLSLNATLQFPPSLTSFTARGYAQAAMMRDEDSTLLSLFTRCRLKHLSLSRFGLPLRRLADLFQLPSMSGLETLRMEEYDFHADVHVALGEAAEAAAKERAGAFTVTILSMLKSLHTLHVRKCEGLKPLFDALSHSISLRELIFEPAVKICTPMRRFKFTEECDSIIAHSLPGLQLTLMLFPLERIPATAGTTHFTRHFQERYPLRARVQHAVRETRYIEGCADLRNRQRIIVFAARPIEQDSSRLMALPTVLAHLVFRSLPAQEALVLARCSRSLLKSADAPSAFSALTLSARRLLTMPLDQSHAGLLRHVPFGLVFPQGEPYFLVRDLIPCLNAHPQFRLAEFDALRADQHDWGMSSPRIKAKHCALFHRPAFQNTKAIVLSAIDESLFQTLSLLPALERLRIHPQFWNTPDPLPYFSRSLQFPSLVTLHVVHPTQINRFLPLLYRVPSLRTLILQPMSDATLRRLHQHGQKPWEQATHQPVLRDLIAMPTAAALISLLDANQALCIVLVSKPCPRWDESDIVARRAEMHAVLKALRGELPQRYHDRVKLPAAGELS